MDTTIIDGYIQPPASWGNTEFVGVKRLKELEADARKARENVDVILADAEALRHERTQLEGTGDRSALKRLTDIYTRQSALDALLPGAEDAAEAALKRHHAALWGAWDELAGRANRLRQKLIAERIQKLRENPVIQSSSLSESEVAGMVGQVAEAWPPLRKLHVDRDVSWKMPLEYFVEAERFIAKVEKDPQALEAE